MDQVIDAMMPFFTLAIVAFGMNTVIDESGAHTEMQLGNMRQTIGKNGFDWML